MPTFKPGLVSLSLKLPRNRTGDKAQVRVRASATRRSRTTSDGNEEQYNNNCNRNISNHASGRMCRLGLTKKTILEDGWETYKSTGLNSHMFTKKGLYMKVTKYGQKDYKDEFCTKINTRIRKIWRLKNILGAHAPKIDFLEVCAFNDYPALVTIMKDAGKVNQNIPIVDDRHIKNAAVEMADSGVYSLDLFACTSHNLRVNTGNLAFRMTPKNRKLKVVFLDIDDVSQFQDTRNVPREELVYLWTFVINKCLNRPTNMINIDRYDEMSKHFIPLFK